MTPKQNRTNEKITVIYENDDGTFEVGKSRLTAEEFKKLQLLMSNGPCITVKVPDENLNEADDE